jgi:hypothetical protein
MPLGVPLFGQVYLPLLVSQECFFQTNSPFLDTMSTLVKHPGHTLLFTISDNV